MSELFNRFSLEAAKFNSQIFFSLLLIWIALAIFSVEAVLRWRSARVREIDTCAFEASALD